MDVKLARSDLWRKFAGLQNEMIITKRGRNMFPSLQFRISGLDEDGLYRTSIMLALVDDKKYRFLNGRWDQFEPCIEATHYPREVFVGETKSGRELMKRGISFEKLKITNGEDVCNPAKEIIRVQSMRKYIPVLSIYTVSRNPIEMPVKVGQFQFEESQFIAVTAYQNSAVKDLKVMNNKYAQGFRETVQKRSSTSPLSFTSDESTLSPPEKRQKMENIQHQHVQHPSVQQQVQLENQENIYPHYHPQQQQQQQQHFATHPFYMAAAVQQHQHQQQQQQYYDYYNQYWFNYANHY